MLQSQLPVASLSVCSWTLLAPFCLIAPSPLVPGLACPGPTAAVCQAFSGSGPTLSATAAADNHIADRQGFLKSAAPLCCHGSEVLTMAAS